MAIVVGTGIVVVRDKHFLAARRKQGVQIGAGYLALPGGKPEPGEPVEECGRRETKEETGLDVQILDVHGIGPIFHAVDRIEPGRYHVYTTFLAARIVGGEVTHVEPDKNEPWEWYTLDRAEGEPEATNWVPVRAMRRFRQELGL